MKSEKRGPWAQVYGVNLDELALPMVPLIKISGAPSEFRRYACLKGKEGERNGTALCLRFYLQFSFFEKLSTNPKINLDLNNCKSFDFW